MRYHDITCTLFAHEQALFSTEQMDCDEQAQARIDPILICFARPRQLGNHIHPRGKLRDQMLAKLIGSECAYSPPIRAAEISVARIVFRQMIGILFSGIEKY